MILKMNRVVGAGLVAYSGLYTIQVVFGSLYAEALPPTDVYRVINYFTAVAVLISVAVSWCRKRGCGVAPVGPDQHLAVQAGFFVSLGLAIWFFTLWFRILMLDTDEATPDPDTVVWFFVSALIPMVLGTNGIMLWRSGKSG